MIQKSYTKNYFNIYVWQIISLVLSFLSMFIVYPYITKTPSIFGIYSVCISISIFLAYADIGFLGAGQKYAAEYYAISNRDEEIRIIGFTSFILFIFLILLLIFFLFLSYHPYLLIKNLPNGYERSVASSLILTLALFAPVTLLQRLSGMIFGIRLEDYIIQRINILGNLIKIASVFWFFRSGKYEIVNYFLFTQIINLFTSIIILAIARVRFKYDFVLLFHSIRFNKIIFSKTKNLAFASLFLTITWISYYELDSVVIAKLFGATQVAFYAIGLTILSFFRSILGIIFAPFNARFNHFIGCNDIAGLKTFYIHVISTLASLVVFPILAISFFAKPLVLSWLGINYTDSIQIVSFLALCNIFAFISYPTSSLLMAQERIKEMYLVSTIIPIVYWVGITITYPYCGVNSFAYFKLIAFLVSAFYYYFIMIKFLNYSILKSIKEILSPIFLPALFIIITSLLLNSYLPDEKSKINMLVVASVISVIIGFAFFIQYFTSPKIRSYIKILYAKY